MATLIDPNSPCILIEFAGPGSAIINNIEFGKGLYPQQLLVAAEMLNLEAKQWNDRLRQQLSLQIAKGGGLITPSQ